MKCGLKQRQNNLTDHQGSPTFITKSTEGEEKTATERWVTKLNENKGRLSCTQYKHRRHLSHMPFIEAAGFPRASFRADVLALWPAEGLRSGQTRVLVIQQFFLVFFFFSFFFLKRPWPSFHGQNHIFFSAMPVQKRWGEGGGGGRWGFLATGGGRGGTISLRFCVLLSLGDKNQCVWRLYCTLRNSRDRQVTGRLLAVEGCYMGGEAVSAVWPSIETQSAASIVCPDLEPTHRYCRQERGLVYESRESASCGGSTLISSVSSVSSLISSSASSSSSSSLAMSWRASLMFRPSL